MNVTFENQGPNTFMVYEIQAEDELDSMSLGMLTNNKIPGFAATSFTQMDATKYIKYNVSSKVSAAQLFNGPVNKKRLMGVFSGIVNAMLSAEEYMIDPASVLLDLDYIFTDVSTCETVLICLPVMQDALKNVDLGMFFKNVIFRTQFDQTENCDHVAQIINYLNSTPILSLGDFKAVLDNLSAPAPKAAQPAAPVQRPVAQVSQPVIPQPVQQVPQPQVQQPVIPEPQPQQPSVPAKKPADFQIPGQQPVVPISQTPVQNAAPAATGEKEMSFMYLMQHYNKENAAIYKAQQDAKKAQQDAKKKEAEAQKAAAKAAKSGKGGKQSQQPPQPQGFQIPGQPQQPKPSFAVPGQQVPVQKAQKPAGFQIPGQAAPVQQPVQKPVQPVVPQPVQKPVQPVIPQSVRPVVSQPVQQQAAPAPQPAFTMNFGETTVLGGGTMGETTVLGTTAVMEPQVKPHLIRAKNNERINLDKPVYRIGKEKSYVDYFIGDNTAISRSHANIINRDGEFFIVDTNSTNHTYVNGGMIQSNVETKISHDTRIRLANEEFIFKLY